MTLPERPEDFSDEEYAELCAMQEKVGDAGIANPEYIRVTRSPIVGTFVNGLSIYDRSKRVNPPPITAMNPTPELTPTQRVEATIPNFDLGRRCVPKELARTLAAELEQAQAKIRELETYIQYSKENRHEMADQLASSESKMKELEATLGTSMSPNVLKIRELQARVKELEFQLERKTIIMQTKHTQAGELIHRLNEKLAASESRAAVMRSALEKCVDVLPRCIGGVDESGRSLRKEALAIANLALEGGQP